MKTATNEQRARRLLAELGGEWTILETTPRGFIARSEDRDRVEFAWTDFRNRPDDDDCLCIETETIATETQSHEYEVGYNYRTESVMRRCYEYYRCLEKCKGCGRIRWTELEAVR